eukprot:GFKZ01003427.1.p1 GENE.GFKZ01003427.1~~GFKZ01003427.1.p1  ORF type:complete len:292 (-),score=47.92 GFKZ01003427.1:710-1585(-)
MPVFGQVVVGPPGSGKTTYCAGMMQFFKASGRKAVVFNMDPANEQMPYKPDVDITELVSADKVAQELSLGPNGSLLYAMEFLEKNIAWLEKKLTEQKDSYVLFDFPGQIELYTHNDCIRNIVQRLLRKGHRLTAVNLVDSHYCSDPSKFIAVMVTSVTLMLQLEMPAVNVLSKVDLIEQYGKLPMNLESYTNLSDLRFLQHLLATDSRTKKFAKLNEELVEIVEDFPFVSYHTLDIQSKESIIRLSRAIDKSNGYVYATMDANKLTYEPFIGKPEMDPRWTMEVQERYMKD